MSKHTDLSIVPISVAPSPATSGTSLGVTDANASLLPNIYPWWALVKPTGEAPNRSNSEIIKVTNGSSSSGTTTFTIVRAQGVPATTARTIIIGDDILEVHTAQRQTDNDFNLVKTPVSDHSIGENSITIQMTANEIQTVGDLCFINTDGEAQIGDADAIATAKIKLMCASTVSANATGTYLILGTVRDDSWNWIVGADIYLSRVGTSLNTLTQTAPTGVDDCVVYIGYALSADTIMFEPSKNIIERT